MDFQKMKDRITCSLVLTLPEGIDGFVVCFNAVRILLGCVLMQNGKSLPMPQGNLRCMKITILPMIWN